MMCNCKSKFWSFFFWYMLFGFEVAIDRIKVREFLAIVLNYDK